MNLFFHYVKRKRDLKLQNWQKISKSDSNSIKETILKVLVTPNRNNRVLRYSFATHPPESQVYLRHIKEILWHNSKSTEIYTRVSRATLAKIKNLLNGVIGESL